MCNQCKRIIFAKSDMFRNGTPIRTYEVEKYTMLEWVLMTGATLDCMCGCGEKSEYLLANKYNNTLLGITSSCTGHRDGEDCNCTSDDLIKICMFQNSCIVRFGYGADKQHDSTWYKVQIPDKPYLIKVVDRGIVDRAISQNVSTFECECGCNSFLTIILYDTRNGDKFIIGKICSRDAWVDGDLVSHLELSQVTPLIDNIKNMTEEQIRFSLENRMASHPHINMFELSHLTKQTGSHTYSLTPIDWTNLSVVYPTTKRKVINLSKLLDKSKLF